MYLVAVSEGAVFCYHTRTLCHVTAPCPRWYYDIYSNTEVFAEWSLLHRDNSLRWAMGSTARPNSPLPDRTALHFDINGVNTIMAVLSIHVISPE